MKHIRNSQNVVNFKAGWSRRKLLTSAAATGLVAPAILRGRPARAGRTLKIGHVSPQSGPIAAFAEADPFVLEQIRTLLANGIENQGEVYPVEIISKDSQSNPNRAAEVAAELILEDEVESSVSLEWTWRQYSGSSNRCAAAQGSNE
ncbi:MAG: hypothetical protein AAF637_27730, partial [Pseudomonadota bacterium]